MSEGGSRLPDGFAALESFVDDWAIAGSAARAARRDNSSEAERAAFYAVAAGLLEPALTLLDGKPLDALDDKERRLLDLMLTLAHVSIAVEIQRDHEPRHMVLRRKMRITRSPADAEM